MNVSRFALAALLLGPLGCSSAQADLPPGWESAHPMLTFSQSACTGSPSMTGNTTESITVTPDTGSVSIAYHNAHFRCDQRVEGFVNVDAGQVDYLVQPIDMNPAQVTRCDCLYEIKMQSYVVAGPETFNVYRRSDHESGNASAMKVATASLTVP